ADGDKEAQQIVAKVATDVFGVHSLDATGKSGLTVAERIELVMAFDLYLMQLKKNIGRSRTRRKPSASMPPKSNEPTTKNTSDSGCTESVPQSETPTHTGSAY